MHTEKILPVSLVPRQTRKESRPKEMKALELLGSLGESFVLAFFFFLMILGIESRTLCTLKNQSFYSELWTQPHVTFYLSPEHLLASFIRS